MLNISNNNVVKTIKLADSLIIKSHAMAVHMNMMLEKLMGVTYDSDDMTTWAYFKNLSGEPHSANTDILLTSIDTGEEIIMTKDLKLQHPKTYTELISKGEYYRTLVKSYRGQELYILGMLHQLDINDTINAEDGTILYYNSDYVEYNEQSLIIMLEANIKGYMNRWLSEEVILTDDLYMPGFYGTLIGFVAKKIYNIRFRNISTYEVNNYYKTAILNSYMGIGLYTDVLSKDVILWLVKNIDYLNYNVGKHDTLRTIVNKIFIPSDVYVDELVLERVRTEEDEKGIPIPVTDQLYIRNFESDEYIKYDPSNLEVFYKNSPYIVDIASDIEKISTIRGNESKTKYLILTDRFTDITSLYYNIELLFDVIVVSLNSDDLIQFQLDSGRSMYITKKDILRTFIYLLMREYTDKPFTIASIVTHSLVTDLTTDYYIGYTSIMEYLQGILTNIESIYLQYTDFIKQQDEISKYLLLERSNLTDDFIRYEFDRFVDSIRKDLTINIDIDDNISNGLLTSTLTLDDLFKSICDYLNIEIPNDTRINKFKEIMDRLTSYTISTIANRNVADAFIPDCTMKLEGPTIMNITDVTLDCQGAIAEPATLADTNTIFIMKGNNDVLLIEDVPVPIVDINAYVGSTRIIKDRPIIQVIDAGV